MKNFILNGNRRGIILFSVLCGTLVLIIIIAPLVTWSANEFSWTTRSFKSLQALNLADAGAELAIWEIAHNDAKFTGWSGANPKTLTLSSFTDDSEEAIGDITVSAENTAPDHYLLTSRGFISACPGPTVKKTVKVKVFPHPIFNNGVFGNNSVTLSGNCLVDSYDSNVEPYSPVTAGDNADVGTNGTLALLENAEINGDVFIGPDGTITGDIPAYVTGEAFYSGNDVELEEIPFLDYFISLPSEGNLSIAKDDFPIVPGDYRYESITVDGKATLSIQSNTRIYVHNDFNLSGQAAVFTNDAVEIYIDGDANFAGQGIVNTSGTPGELIIYGIGSDTQLSFIGNNDFSGTVYAPDSSIYMSGEVDYYGSVIGNDVELAGNIKFHFDETLLEDGPFIGYDIAYWQED